MRCAFIKAGGERCKGIATAGATYCYAHDPTRAAERARNASKGGRTGGNGRGGGDEVVEAKKYTRGIIAKLLSGAIDRGDATAAFMGLNTLARYIDLERKIHEQDELEERLAEVERIAAQHDGRGRTWPR